MSCTYIDLCPLTPDDRYIRPVNLSVLTQPIFHPRFNCLFHSTKEAEIQGQLDAPISHAEEPSVRQHVEVQQRYVENLQQEIQNEQRRAESELQREQARLQQQHSESECSFKAYRKIFRSMTKYVSFRILRHFLVFQH